MLIESLSGVRGHEADLTPEILLSYGIAFAQLTNSKKIMIGRDTRPSGSKIQKTITAALNQARVSVIDLGICPTPTVQYAVELQKADGGIVITASHNPLPWNGLKFIGRDGLFLSANQMHELRELRIASGQKIGAIQFPEPSSERYPHSIEDHIKAVLNIPYINPDQIRAHNFKVAIDAVNGAAYRAIPELLKALNCELTTLYCDPQKVFPHTPEPLPENLTELRRTIAKGQFDIGFAMDPDGDRLAVIDNKGEPLSEEYTLVLASDLVLSKSDNPKKIIVTNLSTTLAVNDIAKKYVAKVYRTPIGEINVALKMRATGAQIGGEGNGGVVLPDVHLGRDSLVAAVLILQLLAEADKPLSQLRQNYPSYKMVKKKIESHAIDLVSL